MTSSLELYDYLEGSSDLSEPEIDAPTLLYLHRYPILCQARTQREVMNHNLHNYHKDT